MPRSSNFIFISLTPSLEQSTTSKSQGHPIAIMRFHASLFLVAIAATAASAQDDCPFFPGICPVTLDNTVGVSNIKPIKQRRNRSPREIPETLLCSLPVRLPRRQRHLLVSEQLRHHPVLQLFQHVRRHGEEPEEMLPLRPMRRGLSRMHDRYGGAARSRMRQLDLPRIFMGKAAVTFVSFAGPTTPDVGDCLSKKKTFPPRKNQLAK